MGQKTALIIGGTREIGSESVDFFRNAGYEVVSASRHPRRKGTDQLFCDVSKPRSLKKFLTRVKREHETIDAVVCVAGFGERCPKRSAIESWAWKHAYLSNCGYAEEAFRCLRENIEMANRPLFFAFGSRWIWMENKELIPYCVMKRALFFSSLHMSLIMPKLTSVFCCPAPTRTKNFARLSADGSQLLLTFEALAEPKVITTSAYQFATQAKPGFHAIVIQRDGSIVNLKPFIAEGKQF